MRPSWLLAHLAQQTKPHHAAADGDRLAILDRPTSDEYKRWLGRIYCFEAPIEAACIATAGLPPAIVRSHLKTSRLERDLELLGFALREPPTAGSFESPTEALGWLYVLHRNTLLHGVIYRQLCSTLPSHGEHAASYLATFEGRAGEALRELGDAILAYARRPSQVETVVAAASEAFRVQHQWFSTEHVFPMRPMTSRPSQAA